MCIMHGGGVVSHYRSGTAVPETEVEAEEAAYHTYLALD